MVAPMQAVSFSDDQAEAYDRVADQLRGMGVDLANGALSVPVEGKSSVLAVVGKAGSGKTMLLASLTKALIEAGLEVVSGDWEGRKRKERRTLAILAPTNKAASVLRLRGVPATTIHRILYSPVYDPQYERIAEWLAGNGKRPEVEGLSEMALDRAKAFYEQVPRSPARWPRPVSGGRTSSRAGKDGTNRSTWASWTRPRCLTNDSSTICARSFRRWSCSAIRPSSRRWASRARWCSTRWARRGS